MRAHQRSCGWFWAWAGVGFALALSAVATFSIGPFLLPFATLLLGVAAARRAHPGLLALGAAVAVAGDTAALAISTWIVLATPLVTLVLGISPAVPRTGAAVLRVALIAVVVAVCATAALSASSFADAPLVILPLALAAFALAAAGRLDVEVTGALTGVGLCAALLGGPPVALLLIALGVVAFPLLRGPAPTPAAG
jgi:hypothetical protein